MHPAPSPMRRLSEAPRLYVQEGFASDEEVRHVLASYGDRDALTRRGLPWQANETGVSSELPVEADPVLAAIAARIEAVLGFSCTLEEPTFRFRRYARGDAHPPHLDEYTIGGARLVATAIVYLTDAAAGGETFFPRAEPHPRAVAAQKGRLALWFNHRADGSVDRAALHQSNTLREGEKATITYFVYAPVEAARAGVVADEAPAREEAASRRFVCVNDGVPEATIRVLREACAARGVVYEEVQAADFDFTAAAPLPPGTLLFRPAVSTAAVRVEQALCGPGVVTFHREPDGVFREIGPDCAVLERRGISVPRWIWGNTTNRGILRRYVDDLGGLPIVMKFAGGSGGVGVLRIDSLAGLFSTMDHARASGRMPVLSAYIPDATHHRCIVVGDRVVGFWRNRTDEDDFRTHATDDPADYQAPPAPEILASAVAATAALDVELGGVDVLEHPSGRHYVLEVNFPCYFARARLVGGHDVGGAMIDWLVRKAERGGGR
ncbi:2OG-Fe(II) oxygenase [Polyangium sorediatum]|uniref:2OG-Fe(II) oxygenase n=1 Tax=Polyangium sorediatum TaxID=889274 RepID=A0ABT6P2T6_9BACT|nr:2OG-Fe(II) oxygenase [Polyangium sorediatum]MDI1434555.1 2OG-Fe(II) oxygenase [Polyangium sorediatum]